MALGTVDCAAHPKLADTYKIKAYPTLRLFKCGAQTLGFRVRGHRVEVRRGRRVGWSAHYQSPSPSLLAIPRSRRDSEDSWKESDLTQAFTERKIRHFLTKCAIPDDVCWLFVSLCVCVRARACVCVVSTKSVGGTSMHPKGVA